MSKQGASETAAERVRTALLQHGGASSMAELMAETGMGLDELSRALGVLFAVQPGHVEATPSGGFAVVLDAPNLSEVPPLPPRTLTAARAALAVVFGAYSLLYVGVGLIAAAILSGQSKVIHWLVRFVRGEAADAATGKLAVPSLRARIEAFFLGPETLVPGRWAADKTALAAAQLRNSTLTVVDLMAVFGHDRTTAESELARLVFQHDGRLEQIEGLPHARFPNLPPLTEAAIEATQATVAAGAADEIARQAEVIGRDRTALGLGATNIAFGLLIAFGGLGLIGLGGGWARFFLGWVPLLLSIALLAVALSRGRLHVLSRKELVMRGHRARIIREVLMSDGIITRDVATLSADERTLIDELCAELGGRAKLEGSRVVAKFIAAYAWAMKPLESPEGD